MKGYCLGLVLMLLMILGLCLFSGGVVSVGVDIVVMMMRVVMVVW